MTGHDDFDRRLPGWFEADALAPVPADTLDRVVDATRRRRPRPTWLAGPGSHWVGDARTASSSAGVRTFARADLRLSTELILLLATVALVAGAVLIGAGLAQPPLPTDALGRLTYVLDGDIYLADWDGANRTRIGESASSDDDCAAAHLDGGWSPDGRYLAYRSGSGFGCAPHVHISDAQGTVVASWAAGVGWDVAWAPDSTRVVAWGPVDGTIDIRGVNGELQAELRLPEGFCVCGDRDPMWAHDGTAILMKGAQDASLPTQYWRLPIPGGPPTPLVDSAISPSCCLAYSPDGAKAAFWSGNADMFDDTLPESEFVVTSADDMSVVKVEVKALQIGGAAWSPTGDRVAVTIVRIRDQDGPVGLRRHDLQLIDVASGRMTTLQTAHEPGGIGPLSFSPDGHRVLFSQGDATGRGSLWSMDTDGSDSKLLVTGTGTGEWQPSPAGP